MFDFYTRKSFHNRKCVCTHIFILQMRSSLLPSCVQKERKLKLLQELLSQLREKLLNLWDSFFFSYSTGKSNSNSLSRNSFATYRKMRLGPRQCCFLLYDHWAILLKIAPEIIRYPLAICATGYQTPSVIWSEVIGNLLRPIVIF
jgi:hypothetical protein